ncbi:hypothetical protein GBA63_04845 [Rubrobacter tropicus]|uniref:CD-NTase-associated protein 12/Pycsar effector protein TIR domain-containing protein n=1 Tax=Rubrobacter tropicus TaxID=2653851 RepID=A0A6G8Q6F0_9ACTN|nr:hypothetical protein [Rubrobacter tropicus]QIN82042.1 hypothetical protein GBA63_04845 [Rubrobacter tropicus]
MRDMVEEGIRDSGQDLEIRGSDGTIRARGLRNSSERTMLFLPEVRVRVGSWIVDEFGSEYHIEDVSPLSDEGQTVAVKAHYKTKAQHEAEQQASRPPEPSGADGLRRRFLGAIFAIAGGNPTQAVSWTEVAPWMGWDRDDQDRFDDALAIASYLENAGLITVESNARSAYLITEAGLDAVAVDPQMAMPPEILATPDEFSSAAPIGEAPIEIQESLGRFKEDHPDPADAAFIMMRFGNTRAHAAITDAVRNGLAAHGIRGIRADDKRYHDHMFFNILTYLHGCGLGVAIYDRIETETYNPNVALEVGYLFAMRKPVCLLKDQTLTTLPTDLVGQLYDPFDPQDAGGTIPSVLSKWLSDKSLV